MISRKEQHNDCTFVSISDAGLSHRVNDIPNQDAVDFVLQGNDYVMAVSDGVGSCKKAEAGSRAAVAAAEAVFEKIHKAGEIPAAAEISQQIIDEWKQQLIGEVLDDCCATLKAVMKFGDRLLLFSIGDGLLVVSSRGMRASAPTDNLTFTNQTKCLNGSVKANELWTSSFKLDLYVSYTVFVCTDGIANGIQERRELDLVAEIETETAASELQNELENLVVDIADYSSDDRTLGVIKYERKNAKPDRRDNNHR